MPTNTVQAVSPYYNPTIEEVSTVPNIKSAKKRVKVAAAKTLQNKMINSQLKTEIKKANVAIESNAADKAEAVKVAVKRIDQAAAKGILHKNTAARKKSALDKKLKAGASFSQHRNALDDCFRAVVLHFTALFKENK